MEHLSNELFKWLQSDAETSVYCTSQNRCALCATYIYAHPRQHLPEQAPPLSPKSQRLMAAERKESPQTETWA